MRHPDGVAAGPGPDGLPPPDLPPARRAHALRHAQARAALHLLHLRLPRALPAAARADRRRLRDRQGRRPHRRHGPHRPRRRERPDRRRRARLAAGARRRLPAAGRPALARARGPPPRRRRGDGALDRPLLRARRLRLELPRARGAPHRRGLLRPALPRQGQHGGSGARRGLGGRALPGQLDPAQAARRHRGRGVLRRRLGRPLPAADRRGHPHGPLLRDRVRPRAAPGRGGALDDRPRAPALRRLQRLTRVEVRIHAAGPEGGAARASAAAQSHAAGDAVAALPRVRLWALPAGSRRRSSRCRRLQDRRRAARRKP